VVDNAEITKINGGIRRSTSVVFGSIESEPSTAVSPSVSVEGELKDSSSIEKVFKSLAIGMDPADATTVPTTKSRKSAKGGKNIATTGEKEKEDHHHSNKVVNGEIALDPALAKEAEAGATGEMKWKFGNEGLASPPGGVVTELVDGTTVSNAEIIGALFCFYLL
jgi:la-related protein 1